MGRYRGSVCRLCRRDGVKLFLKGPRCVGEKCAIERRNTTPGQHGGMRQRLSEYALQLREKQKLKRIYGLLEAAFKRYFANAEQQKGVTGDNLLIALESRLDSVVYRLGFALSRKQARMLVRQGHFQVNDKPVNIPSYGVAVNDRIAVREKSRVLVPIQEAIGKMDARVLPDWLEVSPASFSGVVRGRPVKESMALPVNEQRVVELYSR